MISDLEWVKYNCYYNDQNSFVFTVLCHVKYGNKNVHRIAANIIAEWWFIIEQKGLVF